MSDTKTRDLRITVRPEFVDAQSDMSAEQYLFAYHVTLSNEGAEKLQVISRHWIITDGNGEVEEVRGPGLVGETPILLAGESFEYSSACPLKTPIGTMEGSFQVICEDGSAYPARIDPFLLAKPGSLH